MYQFPETLPSDEANFVTGGKREDQVEAKLLGYRLTTGASGGAQVDMAFEVLKGNAIKKGEIEPSDVKGEIVITSKSLSAGAALYTFGALRATGMLPTNAVEAYAKDAQALALIQRVKTQLAGQSASHIAEKTAETMTLLAINRGDMKATGAGQFPVRFSVSSEEYNGTSRIKVGFINGIPRDVGADALLDVALNLAGGALAGKKDPARKGQTSTTPAKEPNTDDVSF